MNGELKQAKNIAALCSAFIVLTGSTIGTAAPSAAAQAERTAEAKRNEKTNPDRQSVARLGAVSSAGLSEISPDYARSIARKVNALVSKEFFDAAIAEGPWKAAYEQLCERLKDEKTAPKTLIELDKSINQALQSLKTSHSQFETLNDETFFFLHSLFGTINKRFRTGPHAWGRPITCTGLATGGCGFDDNQIRYVLDGSPADKAGLLVGDRIKRVDGRPYEGYLNFFSRAGQELKLLIDRPGDGEKEFLLTPERKDLYTSYVDATRASKKIIKQGNHTIGYVHLWTGGGAAAEAVNEILTGELKDVDGLIYDLRDGYGGASFTDLDLFFRPRAGFPDCISKQRDGKVTKERQYFDKPMVVLINSGSRSGKELLAYGFKNTGRAKLVGENTAGAVVAGRLFPIDGKCALYLAVCDIELEGN
jgi:carboxyl-terminal processing protease